ncbi:MAG: metalloregulator ArsR/SmtB family transcription factor [Arenicellales bacterium]
MVECKQNLSVIFKAVSDQTRRSILTLLVQQGPCRVTDLAGHYQMSLNAVSKHIKVLESAGLVNRTTVGRVHLIEACLDDIDLVEHWVSEMKSFWALRLDALQETLNGDKNDESH